MRIGYIHQYFSSPESGGGTRSWEFAHLWADHGHEVVVICGQMPALSIAGDRMNTTAGVRLLPVGSFYRSEMSVRERKQAFARFAWGAIRALSTANVDVVYATSTPLTVAIPALVAKRTRGLPFVFEVRDLWPDVPVATGHLRGSVQVKAAYALERRAYRSAAHIVAISPGIKSRIVGKGIPPSKISVITHGCDMGIFGRGSAQTINDANPWLGDSLLVVYAGSLGQANDVSYVLQIAEAMGQLNPSVNFVVVGTGPQESALVREATARGLLDRNVRFLGKKSKYEVADWLARADMSLALLNGPPVLWADAAQNKFFDSLAAGTPVAVNNSSWQSDLAVREGVGVRLDAHNYEVAARQLQKALTDRKWMLEAAIRARALANGPFNRDRLAAEALKIVVEAST